VSSPNEGFWSHAESDTWLANRVENTALARTASFANHVSNDIEETTPQTVVYLAVARMLLIADSTGGFWGDPAILGHQSMNSTNQRTVVLCSDCQIGVPMLCPAT